MENMVTPDPNSKVQDLFGPSEETKPSTIVAEPAGISEQVLSLLAAHIRNTVNSYQFEKALVQQEIERCKLQARSEYDEVTVNNYSKTGIGCTDYQPLTEAKINVAHAMLFDIVYQAGDRPWMIEPTSEPDLPEKIYAEITKLSIEEMQRWEAEGIQFHAADAYQLGNDMRHDYAALVNDEAKKRAEAMQKKMDDQLEEGGFWQVVEGVAKDFCTYPACFMRATVRKERTARFCGGKLVEEDKDLIQWERVSPFHAYPSRNNKDLNRDSLFMKVSYNRAEIYSLRDTPGYNSSKIDEALTEFGGAGLVEKDATVTDNVEASRYDDSDMEYTGTVSSGVIEGYEYWGNVPGKMLKDWGMTEDFTDLAEYAIHAILIGNYIIFAELNTNALNRKQFYTASYENDLDSVWGGSLPRKVRSAQNGLNSARRALITNMALTSGPLSIIDVDALDSSIDPLDLFPLKSFLYHGSDRVAGNKSPVEFYQPSANLNQLLPVMDKFLKEADDFSGLPRYSQGDAAGAQTGAAGTATGLSMLMNAQSKTFKKVIANFDCGIIQKPLEDLYYRNLADPEIPDETKGDMRIVTRGVLGMSIKEQTMMRQQELLTMILGSEVLMGMIEPKGLVKLMREVVKNYDIAPEQLLPNDTKLEEMENQAQQNEALSGYVELLKTSFDSGIIDEDQLKMMFQMLNGGGQGIMNAPPAPEQEQAPQAIEENPNNV